MKKLIFLFVIALTSAAANAQVAQQPAKKTIDVNTRQKAKKIKRAATIQAIVQKQKNVAATNNKKN